MSAVIKWLNLQANSPEYMPAWERQMFSDTLTEIKRLLRIEAAARADMRDMVKWRANLNTVLKNNRRNRRELEKP